ncbi:hypothetical protein L873DRAFT_1266553 [Choiromyces venosus 120613-1]|uniref:Transmembrane protein n=1 Tax=Choiromyces venosus 120613-1 TaxID=1336337 RepID=A0A3N4JCG3_9PEZI|nr:hypothetical protein L873DRAFT_1266553 [Choiromyces venosus 120613-1]
MPTHLPINTYLFTYKCSPTQLNQKYLLSQLQSAYISLRAELYNLYFTFLIPFSPILDIFHQPLPIFNKKFYLLLVAIIIINNFPYFHGRLQGKCLLKVLLIFNKGKLIVYIFDYIINVGKFSINSNVKGMELLFDILKTSFLIYLISFLVSL